MELSEKETLAVIEGYEKKDRYWLPTPGVVEQQMFMDGFLFGKEYFSHGWQPISQAPRDGTVVDLWHKDGYRFVNMKFESHSFLGSYWVSSQLKAYPETYEFTHFKYITGPEDV